MVTVANATARTPKVVPRVRSRRSRTSTGTRHARNPVGRARRNRTDPVASLAPRPATGAAAGGCLSGDSREPPAVPSASIQRTAARKKIESKRHDERDEFPRRRPHEAEAPPIPPVHEKLHAEGNRQKHHRDRARLMELAHEQHGQREQDDPPPRPIAAPPLHTPQHRQHAR